MKDYVKERWENVKERCEKNLKSKPIGRLGGCYGITVEDGGSRSQEHGRTHQPPGLHTAAFQQLKP